MTQRIASVTGGSRGLDKSAALKLAAKGTDILLIYHSSRQAVLDVVAETEQKGVKAAALALNAGGSSTFNVLASEVAQALTQKWGRTTFDYLLNNTGISFSVPFAETSEVQFDELMNIQFKGPFFPTQRLLPLLQDGERIFDVPSGLVRSALPGYAAYAAMKGAMEVLIRYQAKELGRRGISVNIVASGAIRADFDGGVTRDSAEVNQHITVQIALGHVGLLDDIGDATAALPSDELAWMNAQRVEVLSGIFL